MKRRHPYRRRESRESMPSDGPVGETRPDDRLKPAIQTFERSSVPVVERPRHRLHYSDTYPEKPHLLK